MAYAELFDRLQNLNEMYGLIGKTEDLYLDCKVWPTRSDDAQRILAKALCGFANAEGGVIVIGLDARRGLTKYDPDVIQQAKPVADVVLVKSMIENLIGDIVEPRLEGVLVAAVPDPPGQNSGFVLVRVPPTDGLPCRSRKDHEFYQRISAGTYPMEYYQIADMFGRRQRPKLHLWLEDRGWGQPPGRVPERELMLGIENRGRGIAKFPCIRFNEHSSLEVSTKGVDGGGSIGLPMLPTETGVIMFAGGSDHVIYPGGVLHITILIQHARRTGWVRHSDKRDQYEFEELRMAAELSADGMMSITETTVIPALEIQIS